VPVRAIRRLFRPKLGHLDVCVRCGGDYVHPISWAEEAPGLWRVGLRCGACEHERETVARIEHVQAFNRALDRGFEQIEAAADRLERERLEPADL
jgi:hypothetical protein